ncbi:MAG: DUF5995 family protein [Ferruginibacter sp.]
MKLFFAIIFYSAFAVTQAQLRYNNEILDTLEQIAATKTVSVNFARLYHNAIEKTNLYAKDQPENIRQFIFGFETAFSQRFIKAHQHFMQHQSQDFSWQYYYSDTSLNELQYQFIGMNAHINGDMWQALKDKYSYDTLRKYKRPLIKFQQALNIFFDSVYTTTGKYKKIKHLHEFTLGLDKAMGRRMVLQWRKRQVKMAMLFYRKPKKCARKWNHLQKQMLRWDERAVNWIHN